jgi:hypothetical protein
MLLYLDELFVLISKLLKVEIIDKKLSNLERKVHFSDEKSSNR